MRQHGVADLVKQAFERGRRPADARHARRRPTARIAVAFARVLRGAGLHGARSAACSPSPRPSAAVGLDDRDAVYWAGRATLVRRPEDLALYDRAFAVFWELRQPRRRAAARARSLHVTLGARRRGRATTTATTATPSERRPDDHAALLAPARCCATRTSPPTPRDELDEAQRLMADLRLAGSPCRPSRRLVAPRRHRRPAATCAAPSAPRCGPAASRSAAATASRASGPGGSCCCSTSRLDGALRPGAAALRPRRRGRPAAGRGVRPRHPAHPAHPGAVSSRDPDVALAAGRRAGAATGRAAPGSARACAGSTTSGACGAWPAAPSS